MTVSSIHKKKLLISFFIIICFLPVCLSQNAKLKVTLPENYGYDSIASPDVILNSQNATDTARIPSSTADLIEQNLPIDEIWWKSFNDPLLDSLLNLAISNNWDLLIAQNRIVEAKAAMRTAYGALMPDFGISAGWTRDRYAQTGMSSIYGMKYYSNFSGMATMSWEIDVFGTIWQKARSQKELYKASKADYNATMVSMAASLGSAYINLRTAQTQVEVTRANIESQFEVLRITEARYAAGLSSLLDVSQAKSTYYSTRASICSYETAVGNYINSIALLTGTIPSDIAPVLIRQASLPSPDRLVPVSVPAGLLRQRPDIRAAEYTVNSQAALLGAAKAEWLPTFFLNGQIGVAAHDMNQLFKDKSLSWEIAPVMKWTIFNGGQRAAGVTSAKASLEQSINNYNLTVLTALQEVDNSIIAYKNSVHQAVEIRIAALEAQKSLELSIELYKMGLSAFINVVDAQQTLLSYQTSLVSAEGSTMLNLISLYQALGGGWDETIGE